MFKASCRDFSSLAFRSDFFVLPTFSGMNRLCHCPSTSRAGADLGNKNSDARDISSPPFSLTTFWSRKHFLKVFISRTPRRWFQGEQSLHPSAAPGWRPEDEGLSHAGPRSRHQYNGISSHTCFPHSSITPTSASVVPWPSSLCMSVFSHGFLLSVLTSSLCVCIQISFL